MGHMVQRLDKITYNMALGHFSNISTSRKLKMNMFSGSNNLWRLLGEHEPFNALYCYCKRFFKTSGGWPLRGGSILRGAGTPPVTL